MKTYYKNPNQSTSFNKENGELVNIFKHNGSLTFSLQIIEESQRDLMVTNLEINNGVSNQEEFDVVLVDVKAKLNTI
jgi:hypothetical protein